MAFTATRLRLPVFRSRRSRVVTDPVDGVDEDAIVDAEDFVEEFPPGVAHALAAVDVAAHPAVDTRTVPASIPGDALVLSGGGLHGSTQAGMLRALARTGWRPSVIVGVSAGALNGVFVAHHFTVERADALAGVWRAFDGRGPFPARTVSQLWKVVSRSHAVQDGAALRAVIDRLCPVTDLADLAIPTHVAATDLVAGDARWFTTGPAADILYASAAIPGLVPPIEIDGTVFVDGGVVANVPVARAVAAGARRVLVLDVSADPATAAVPSTALGVLLRSFTIARNTVAEERVAAVADQVTVWRVRPELPDGVQLMDWHRCPELVEVGERTMQAWLDANPGALDPPPSPPAHRPGPRWLRAPWRAWLCPPVSASAATRRRGVIVTAPGPRPSPAEVEAARRRIEEELKRRLRITPGQWRTIRDTRDRDRRSTV